MKKTILALLLLVSFSGIAQSKKGVTKQKSAIPVFMIDSIRVNKAYFDYMNANDIASFYEFRNEQYPDGILYITTKNPAEMLKYLQSPLVSLNDITKTVLLDFSIRCSMPKVKSDLLHFFDFLIFKT